MTQVHDGLVPAASYPPILPSQSARLPAALADVMATRTTAVSNERLFTSTGSYRETHKVRGLCMGREVN